MISGIVEFKGPPLKLPTTTTKRGLNYSSGLYQQVLDRMRDGMRLFVDFTNHWKSREADAKALVSPAPALMYSELKRKAEEELKFNPVYRGIQGEQYKPRLPMPPSDSPDARISYVREKEKIFELAEELVPKEFEDLKNNDKQLRKRVGEASFDYAYEHLVRNEETSE